MEIEILYHSENTKMLKDLDMDFNWDDLDRVMAYFNNIDVALPYVRDGVEYTEIHSGGHTYISTVPYLLIKKILISI